MVKALDYFRDKHGDKRWFVFLEQLALRFEDDGVTEIGAQLTYYLTLSIFPFIIFFLNLLQYTPLADVDVLNQILSPLPMDTQNILLEIIRGIMENSNAALLSFGAIATIWSASNGIMAVIKAVNRAFDLDEDRPYLKLKGLSIIFTLGLFLVLIVAFGILVFGKVIVNQIFVSYNWVFSIIWNILRILIPLGFMILMFALLYKFAPSIKDKIEIKLKDTIPGSIFTAITWIILSVGFSFYVNNFGNYTKTYGSLGGIIILLIWLYMSSIVIVLGAEVNATLLSMKDKQVGSDIEMLSRSK